MIRTVSPTAPEVVALINKLNQYQISLYGIEKCNLESPESLAANDAFMIGMYIDETLAGIGAIKFCGTYAEIKRMYVDEKYRGRSIAAIILSTLEIIAFERGYSEICLETGNKHDEALRFYQRSGYRQIEKFGTYTPNDVSIYFCKNLTTDNSSMAYRFTQL